jgi:hypothetical protein
MPLDALNKFCTAMVGCALFAVPIAIGQAPNEVNQTDATFEIERTGWSGEVNEDQSLVVNNNFGNVICRFGGAEGQAEITAVIQHFALEGPRLEVVTLRTKEEVLAIVGFREQEAGELNTEPDTDHLKRADLVIFVPEGRSLEVLSRNGMVDCRGIRGDVTATTTSGAVRIRGTTGRVVASTESGPVTVVLSPHGSKNIQRVQTVSGRIEAHIPENADLEVRVTTHGEIHSDYGMEATQDASGGSPKRGVLVIASAGSELELTSDTGSIGIVRRLATE